MEYSRINVVYSDKSYTLEYMADDNILTIRRRLAVLLGVLPGRLYIEARVTLRATHYSDDPKHWRSLFTRIAKAGEMTRDELVHYVQRVRSLSLVIPASPQAYTLDEWMSLAYPFLAELQTSAGEFSEVRPLGVPEEKAYVLPIPMNAANMRLTNVLVVKNGRLLTSLYPGGLEQLTAYTVTDYSETNGGLNPFYFPLLAADGPSTAATAHVKLQEMRDTLRSSDALLLKLHAFYRSTPIVHSVGRRIRALKWRIPLRRTEFGNTRNRLEQMFYGLTVSPSTPYVGLYNRGETMRNKYYTADGESPAVRVNTWWQRSTQQQYPALVLYRGTASKVYDRIAITDSDIVISTHRGATDMTVEDIRDEMLQWLQSLDSVTPFLVPSDLDVEQWRAISATHELQYEGRIETLRMDKLECLRDLFVKEAKGENYYKFRIVRADKDLDLYEEGIMTLYAAEIAKGRSHDEAILLLTESGYDTSKVKKEPIDQPYVEFTDKAAIVTTIGDAASSFRYADLLRYALSASDPEFDKICPDPAQRMESAAAAAPPPQIAQVQVAEDEDFGDVDLGDLLLDEEDAQEEAPPPPPQPAAAAAVEERKEQVLGNQARVRVDAKGTQGYFHSLAARLEPTAVKTSSSGGPADHVAMMPLDKFLALPATLTYGKEEFKAYEQNTRVLKISEKTVALCPRYWCVVCEIPLEAEDLSAGNTCPRCGNGMKTAKSVHGSIIDKKGDKADDKAFPKFGKNGPACYITPRSTVTGPAVIRPKPKDNVAIDYVLTADKTLPALRIGKLRPQIAERLGIADVLNYSAALVDGQRLKNRVGGIFRVGIGARPRESLPFLLRREEEVKRQTKPRFDDVISPPSQERETVKKCSFYRTWSVLEEEEAAAAGTSLEDRLIASIDKAWTEGTMPFLDELEYCSMRMVVKIILLDAEGETVSCGFGLQHAPTVPTILVLGNDALCHCEYGLKEGKKNVVKYNANVNTIQGIATFRNTVVQLHSKACTNAARPTLDEALTLAARHFPDKMVFGVRDPFDRLQSIIVPTKVVLPIDPTSYIPSSIITVNGYSEVPVGELPEYETARDFLKDKPGFTVVRSILNSKGEVTELLLSSSFRSPVVPKVVPELQNDAQDEEMLETMRAVPESILVRDNVNEEDQQRADQISYESEIFEFLLFSLSKDLSADESGSALRPEFAPLRVALENAREPSQRRSVFKLLREWVQQSSYEQDLKGTPLAFINKVRKPCGQLKDAAVCSKSTLCGWSGDTCKVKLRQDLVSRDVLLERMTQVLLTNDKQRALVLDDRISPFFSTVLYLQMPHELITTTMY